MPPLRVRPPGGNIPPANRTTIRRKGSRLTVGNALTEMAKRLAEIQQRITETEARSGDTAPQITHGISFGGLERSAPDDTDDTNKKVWRSYAAEKRPRQRLKPPPEPYSVNSWKTDAYFGVLIEGVKTPNWHDHSHGISVSVHGDVLRIVDTREHAPLAALIELIIPKEYDPNLRKATSWGEVYDKSKGVELRFERKERVE